MGFKSSLSHVASALTLLFTLQNSSAVELDDQPHEVDSTQPIASLCQGAQQFTIARDTAHGDPAIPRTILDNLDGCAKAGVKHIMLEDNSAPKAEIERVYPNLVGKTPEQAGSFFDQEYKVLYDKIYEKVQPLIQHVDPYDEKAWGQAYQRGNEKVLEDNPAYQQELNQLNRFSASYPFQDLLDRWYAPSSKMEVQDLRDKADFFRSASAQNEEDQLAIVENRIQLFLKSRELGVRVHFFGDNPGAHFFLKKDLALEDIDAITQEIDVLIAKNPDIHREYRRYVTDRDYAASIDVENMNPDEEERFSKVVMHWKALSDLHEQKSELHDIYMANGDAGWEERFGAEALEARAQAYIDMSEGMKTLIVRGAAHFNGSTADYDVDEYLDHKLKEKTSDFVPSKQISLYTSREEQPILDNALASRTGRLPNDEADINFYIEEGVVQIPDKYQGQYVQTDSGTLEKGAPSVNHHDI